jgi:hypothetical protein
VKRKNSRGQSLVESALVLAAFMGLVAGMGGVGEMLFSRQTLAGRAHDAARWGAVNSYDPDAIRNVVLYGTAQRPDGQAPLLGLPRSAVIVGDPGCPGPDCRVVVAIPDHGIQSTEPVERLGDRLLTRAAR